MTDTSWPSAASSPPPPGSPTRWWRWPGFEQVGLDLVTFQDHPYQPGFLDTWTLMSYVAAATERVRLAGNVLNPPLRQPAVLARSVASLDLLTGGRGSWAPARARSGTRSRRRAGGACPPAPPSRPSTRRSG
ncbi:LLM class flavin-dependent oxidoreductase [Micromonospora sp. BRA006-A]|nr:LLM class flavin-dependent oxidoreductase [Micromonospora sp. BRA006-A]